MWKDAEGNVVTKKPTLDVDSSIDGRERSSSAPQQSQIEDPLQSLSELAQFQSKEHGAPISPLSCDPSLCDPTFDDHDSGIASGYPPTNLDLNALSASESLSPIDQQFWSTDLPQPEPEPLAPLVFNDAPFDDIFNPDTASSFNNPFTTMNNYEWLFDLKEPQIQPVFNDPFPAFQFNDSVSQPSHAFDLQLDHMIIETDKPHSTVANYGSGPSQRTDSPQQMSPPAAFITPPLTENTRTSRKTSEQRETTENHMANAFSNTLSQQPCSTHTPLDLERPMSLLQPSRCLPIIDELARQQVLDLVDIAQPTAPDGSLVMRDHPLLSLSCLQTYCDLFFTRFNTTYPLIHMSTFEPCNADTLLLVSVLLLGATYGEKDAHQLAVCIHDVVRPQIFANAGFSAKPDLWVLQTILLVECFGKSRAGQKQHDMSHLFHGLLINLIRRSDCQSIRSPTLEDATDDLEDDWRTWVDAEQKKRLAFLCFMWDTQHAVLFCQSLCMSAFELRSNLPCDQSLWEADSAESWHQLRQKQPSSPLFLSCLKMYLNPSASVSVPKNLNALSRSLLLHGLMSIAWDMQRRDQTSLCVVDTNPLGNWQTRLAVSYKAWNHDFQAFCASYVARLPYPTHPLAKEFQAFHTAVSSLYHSAHILLHTPFLDLQIYAGARHILGRPVARADYARSQKVVKKWVADNLKEAGKAVWHAAALVEQGVSILDTDSSSSDIGGSRLWHLPWAVYLGTLTIWGVWYARPVPPRSSGPHDEDEDEIIWDPQAEMTSLLETISKSDGERLLEVRYERGIAGGMGKRGTNGLAAVVSRCLGKVRWAVVHDGMIVLRGLVQWRLVGGGGMS
ncbi:hypothetical protein P171DRAFT_364428 [Karstenula rhodostoma CBS 690.94]|uniref:Xylanolytic transcriptional activator regulatory domain-containing protein n=1 Tax=Karstenula rhodostoma CBS 690.94 TaxID=1392251 RepID=A0A9P4U8J1_9PLEO|nr:hypothetical protein P171DRAFT_364428 [Karstenula rhodostoma CBS 690.94]